MRKLAQQCQRNSAIEFVPSASNSDAGSPQNGYLFSVALIDIDQTGVKKTTSMQKVGITQDVHEMQTLGAHEYLNPRSSYEIDCPGKRLGQVLIEIFALEYGCGWPCAGRFTIASLNYASAGKIAVISLEHCPREAVNHLATSYG